MLRISEIEKEEYISDDKIVSLTFDDATFLSNEDIYYESFTLEQTLCDESSLIFGKCIPSELKIKITNIPDSHVGKTFTIKIGTEQTDIDYGTFIVVEDKVTDDKMFREIKAYDLLYKVINTDYKDWYDALWSYDDDGNVIPITIKEFRDSFWEYVGIEQEEIDLVNDSIEIQQTVKPNVLSGKDILESLCEINAVFGQITSDGTFKYIQLQTAGNQIYPNDTLFPSDTLFPKDVSKERISDSSYRNGSLKYEDYKCKKITKLQIRMEEGDIGCEYGAEGNTYTIEDNFLLYGKNQEDLYLVATNFMSNLQFVEYNVLSVETLAKPWLQVGDFIKVICGKDSLFAPILHRKLTGIQLMTDEFESFGTEVYSSNANGIKSEVIKLKGKSNVLERNIEETKSTITALDTKLENDYLTAIETESAISQTAQSINATVSNIQRQVNGQVSTWYGTVVPTLENYPANEWSTNKGQHVGDKYFMKDSDGNITSGYRFLSEGEEESVTYSWVLMSDTDVTQALNEALKAQAQVTELKADVDLTAKQIQATVGESITRWTTSYTISYYGFGHPDTNAVIKSTNPVNKYYLDQLSGYIYHCTNLDSDNNPVWYMTGTAQKTKDYVQSQITQSANGVKSEVASYSTVWDTSDYVISYTNYGTPSNYYYPSSTYSNKYYLNQQNGNLYKCLYNSSQRNYYWSYIKTLSEDKVKKQQIISTINQSAEEVAINASKITLEGIVTANSNFKILSDGSMQAKNASLTGSVTSGSETGDKIVLSTNGSMYTYYNNNQMMDIGYTTFNGQGGVRFNATNNSKFLLLSANSTARMLIGNGYTPDGYVDQIYSWGGWQHNGSINITGGHGLYFFVGGDSVGTKNWNTQLTPLSFYVNGSVVGYGLSTDNRLYAKDCIHVGPGWYHGYRLTVDGSAYASGSFVSGSDINLKHDIDYLDDAIEVVFDNLDAVSYKLNDFESEKTRFGFIAQDVESALEKAGFDNDNLAITSVRGDGMLGLDYQELIPLLWSEVKRLKKRVEELEKGDK